MTELNRRDFLKVAGAGSVALMAIGAGVIATGKILRTGPSRAGGSLVTFRATAGLPQRPYPAYASLVFDGEVNPEMGTGTIRRALYAGAPDAMSQVVFPDTERSYRVTDVSQHGDTLLATAMLTDGSTRSANESPTIVVRIDQQTGDVQAPFLSRQATLTAGS
jgi:hypothetical protein